VFALSKNGHVIWEKNLGPVGKASPVIYKDKIFVISKKISNIPFTAQTILTALQLSTGSILWNSTVGDGIVDDYRYAGFTTPCVSDNTIYIASPDGLLEAFDVSNGESLWETLIYTKGLTSPHLQSSPAFTDGYIYVGTPSGIFYCFNENGEKEWEKSTIEYASILTSPIVADGLVFYYSSNGLMYARGKLDTPEGVQITGSIISIPINIPNDEDFTWGKFYYSSLEQNSSISFSVLDKNRNTLVSNIENGTSLQLDELENKDSICLKATFRTNTNGISKLDWWKVTFVNETSTDETAFYESSYESEGIPPNCTIDVRNDNIGINTNTANFKLEYRDENDDLIVSPWNQANCSNNDNQPDQNLSKLREIISVNLSIHNFTENMTFIQIRFSIKDKNDQITYSEWHDFPQQEYNDQKKSIFYPDEFTPKDQYIQSLTPVCTIKARDLGTEGNISGINVKSASFVIFSLPSIVEISAVIVTLLIVPFIPVQVALNVLVWVP